MSDNTFNYIDAFILANRLSLSELRRERDNAIVKSQTAEYYRETEYASPIDNFPWSDYARCCDEALSCVKNCHIQSKKQVIDNRLFVNIPELKARHDIVEVISRYTNLRKFGRNFNACCPIHTEKHPSLTIYPESQTWHCYGCNRGGDIIEFIKYMHNTDFKGAATILEAI